MSSLSVALVGITIVFSALLILIILITIIGKLVARLEKSKENNVIPTVTQQVLQPQKTVQEPIHQLELVAIITSVIAASMGTSADKLSVKSLRKITRENK